MPWHVQYRDQTGDHIDRHRTPERAIEAACGLIDSGHDVFGIGVGSLTDTIEKDQIALIYDIWARSKYPLGIKRAAGGDQ